MYFGIIRVWEIESIIVLVYGVDEIKYEWGIFYKRIFCKYNVEFRFGIEGWLININFYVYVILYVFFFFGWMFFMFFVLNVV